MKNKHTLAPWVYDQNTNTIHGKKRYGHSSEVAPGADFEGCPQNDIYEVCTVKILHVYDYTRDGKNHPARPDVIQRVREMSEANARLISAAPDMLAELEACARIFSAWVLDANPHGDLAPGDSPELDAATGNLERVRAVIAKAKGQ